MSSFIPLWETDFDNIWNIKNKFDFLVALNGWLCRKSNFGDDIEKLSSTEKTMYFVIQLEAEVNNGGFIQFFYNSSGAFANDIVNAMYEIGAVETAKICNKAVAAFGGIIMPKDHSKRIDIIDNIYTNEIDEILEQCDNSFYKCQDNLVELNYKFVLNNRVCFTR